VSGFLLDTNVVSEVFEPRPNSGVIVFLSVRQSAYVSIITIHELTSGIERLEAGSARQSMLRNAIDEFVQTFASSVLPVDERIARAASVLRAAAQKHGHSAGLADALIAATALVHGLTIATRDVGDFEKLGMPTHNPWN
jgi:toxin FitB